VAEWLRWQTAFNSRLRHWWQQEGKNYCTHASVKVLRWYLSTDWNLLMFSL